MNVIICVDDALGIMFNNRRQSKDIVLTRKIAEITKNHKLWMNTYSEELFSEVENSNVNTADDFLSEAAKGDYCFVEGVALKPYEKWIEKLIVFKWNREYPSDVSLDIDLSVWKLTETEEFVGNSHKLITREVYVK